MTPASGLRVGVCLLPDRPWREDAPRWRAAEAAGFATLWTYDHLSWRSLRDGPWYAAIPLLTAAATVTSRVRLGMLVATPNFRHPVPFGKELMTLDEISAGRLDVGLGAGTAGHDATVLGEPALTSTQRADRFEEFVAMLDELLRSPATSRDGDYFRADDARQIPGCVQRPRVPFVIAAAGPRGMALAARYADTWVTFGPPGAADSPAQWWAAVGRQRRGFDAACAAAGRDPATVRRMLLVSLDLTWAQDTPQAWDRLVDRLVGESFTDVTVHWPRPHDATLPGPAPETFEHIRSRLA